MIDYCYFIGAPNERITHSFSILSLKHRKLRDPSSLSPNALICIYLIMEASGSNVPTYDDEEKVLKGLLEAFGSAFSLEDIASAYCKAGKNADLAAEVLYDMQGSTSTDSTCESNGEVKGEESSKLSCGNFSEKSCQANGNSRASKPKSRPVSGGTVSSIIGKDYSRSTPLANGPPRMSKSFKSESKVMPISELSEAEHQSGSPQDDQLHQDMEDFLFRMLGDGFKLDRDMIRNVLGKCGYNMQKSIDKLLDISAAALDRKSNFVGKSTEKSTDTPKAEVPTCERKMQYVDHSGSSRTGVSSMNGVEQPGELKERNGLENEVLVALFDAPKRHDKVRRRASNAVKRYAAWEVVDGPPTDLDIDQKKIVTYLQKDNDEDVEEEDGYQVLRQAVKEYRGTMKEYYKAAVDAFAKGDHVRAGKLLERGHFFHEKAHDADEESNRKILGSRHVEEEVQGEMLLDLHDHDAKDAVRLLKCHLSSLSGITTFTHLKVIIETKEGDMAKGSCRKRVEKLLEKESIKWTEEENAGTILIHMDSINRKQLSFVKK